MSGSGPETGLAAGDVLLDATEWRKRLAQHGTILAGIVILLAARAVVDASHVAAVGFIAVGLLLFTVAGTVSQRWAVDYQGHRIVVENNPFRGERLSVGGVVVAKGKLGVTNHLRTIITTAAGPEEIVVRTEAGLLKFRCVIRVVRGGVIAASDAALLAEVRRRGLA